MLISLPRELLTDIDREAQRRHVSRSAFIRSAAVHELGLRAPEELEAALAAGRQAMAELRPFSTTDLLATEKRARDERDRRHFGR